MPGGINAPVCACLHARLLPMEHIQGWTQKGECTTGSDPRGDIWSVKPPPPSPPPPWTILSNLVPTSLHGWSELNTVPFLESSEVANLEAQSTNDTTVDISWESPTDPNGRILNYSVTIINLSDGSTVREEYISGTSFTETDLGKIRSVDVSLEGEGNACKT